MSIILGIILVHSKKTLKSIQPQKNYDEKNLAKGLIFYLQFAIALC
jgi:hypothetical protein